MAAPLEISECGRAVRAICRSAGFEPKVHYEIDDFEVTLQLVASVDACAILPALALTRVPPEVRLLPLSGPTRQVIAVTRPAAQDRLAVGRISRPPGTSGRQTIPATSGGMSDPRRLAGTYLLGLEPHAGLGRRRRGPDPT